MAEDIKIELSEEARAIIRDLGTLPDWAMEAIAKALKEENEITLSHVQKEYLSFAKDQPPTEIGLRVQSNRLRSAAWASDPVIEGQKVESAIGDNVDYAAIHEFGGTIPAHDIVPKSAGGVLAFQIGERVVFAKRVHLPEREVKARGMFQRGINDRLTDYSEALSEAIVDAWEARRQ